MWSMVGPASQCSSNGACGLACAASPGASPHSLHMVTAAVKAMACMLLEACMLLCMPSWCAILSLK